MRKTIYVSDLSKWEAVKEGAEKLGMGVGQFLLGRDQKVAAPSQLELFSVQLDRIESKLDLLIPQGSPESLVEEETLQREDADLVAANERLKAKRKRAGELKSLGFFNPLSKDKQLGKKVKN